MLRYLVLSFLLICGLNVLGQNRAIDEMKTKNGWNEGSVLLNDGTELKGLLRYDDRMMILNYQNGEVSRSFTARSVNAFEFFDEIQNKQRVYYALEYEDSEVNAKRPLFFEMLKDFGAFVILSKLDPVDIENKQSSVIMRNPASNVPGRNPSPDTWTVKTEISQVETIYFMDEKGTIEPYLKLTRIVVDRHLYDREKRKDKIVDKDVIDKYFKPAEIEAMEKFADEHDLNFRVKDDFLKILDFCANLRKKK